MTFADDWSKKLTPFIDEALTGSDPWPNSKEGALLKSLRTSVMKVAEALDWDHTGVTKRMQEARTRSGPVGLAKNLVSKKDAVAQLEKFKASLKQLKQLNAEGKELASTVDKAANPKRYRALKALAAGQEKLAAQASYVKGDLEKDLEMWGKNIDQSLQTEKMETLALKNLKKAVMGAHAGIQAIKSDPTVKKWDAQFDGGNIGRNVYMALQLLETSQRKDANLEQAANRTLQLKASLDPYKGKAGRTVIPPESNPAQVLARLKEFSGLVKDVQTHYTALW